MIFTHRTPEEIQREIARKVKQLRLDQNVTQKEIMLKTATSKHALQNLEATGKATVETLVRVLNVLGTDCSDLIPEPFSAGVDPIAIFEGIARRQRARARLR